VSFSHHLMSGVCRPLTYYVQVDILFKNHWAKLDQTRMWYFLEGPLSKLCAVTLSYIQDACYSFWLVERNHSSAESLDGIKQIWYKYSLSGPLPKLYILTAWIVQDGTRTADYATLDFPALSYVSEIRFNWYYQLNCIEIYKIHDKRDFEVYIFTSVNYVQKLLLGVIIFSFSNLFWPLFCYYTKINKIQAMQGRRWGLIVCSP